MPVTSCQIPVRKSVVIICNLFYSYSYNISVNCMIKMYFKPRLKRPPPIVAKRFYFRKRRNKIGFRITSIFLVFVITCVLADMRLRPIIETVGGNALKNSLSNVVDGAVNDMGEELGVNNGKMVNI